MPYGVNKKTGLPGPEPIAARDGDKKQARRRVNVLVRTGKIPPPNNLPCHKCGHVWASGERRHEYHHHLGYAAEHHLDVISICTKCHSREDCPKATQTHCIHGHEFTPANTLIKGNGCRQCRECSRLRDKRRTQSKQTQGANSG